MRDDDGASDLLFQTADTTWQAYNSYGGNSLYTGSPAGRAYKVSYNRPFTTRGATPEDSVFNAEYPMVRWIERNGYDVSYFTGVDSDRYGAEILEHEAFLSVGHDEYWSGTQRTNVEAARDGGVDLAFFSGNEVFWKTRWENSIDGSGTSHRTLVSYKETKASSSIDPTDTWTGTWRDDRPFNPEGPQPENALTGTIFTVNSGTSEIEVPAADGRMRIWRHTPLASMSPGQSATLGQETLGYEWDEDLDNGSRPAGLIRLSTAVRNGVEKLQDNGNTYAPGTATHHLTLYRAASDALVFGAGTVQWSWGLDGNHDRGGGAPDPRMQQATVNLFADMGVQPATLQSGLTAAAASTDAAAPTSQVTAPNAGAEVEAGQQTVISGTATDAGGGEVGGVEVSIDGGPWHPAEGRGDWTYAWTPEETGATTIRSRAADDSANLGSAGAAVTVDVVPSSCPCSIWSTSIVPPIENDTGAVELGVRFRSDVAGEITGLRFYKGAGNTGTHVGHLWSGSGTLLGEATFTGETASGWQEVEFGAPVSIDADTTYVASYHAPNGGYAATQGYFAGQGADSPPLHALADGTRRRQRRLQLRARGGLPDQHLQREQLLGRRGLRRRRRARHDAALDQPPRRPNGGASGVAPARNVTARFNEAMDAATINGANFELRDAAERRRPGHGHLHGRDAHGDASTPTTPLANSTTYTATLKGGAGGITDTAGNPRGSDYTLVVHDGRRPAAAARRGARWPDPRDRQLGQPVQPLLRRDPAGRGPEPVQRHRALGGRRDDARLLRRRDPRRDRARAPARRRCSTTG